MSVWLLRRRPARTSAPKASVCRRLGGALHAHAQRDTDANIQTNKQRTHRNQNPALKSIDNSNQTNDVRRLTHLGASSVVGRHSATSWAESDVHMSLITLDWAEPSKGRVTSSTAHNCAETYTGDRRCSGPVRTRKTPHEHTHNNTDRQPAK